ncbi:hypothetical protein J6590_039263 [Homalodisca vitripennis]|nr:hypothetical protein J6590_039263 [Homalodisca vitripennis]
MDGRHIDSSLSEFRVYSPAQVATSVQFGLRTRSGLPTNMCGGLYRTDVKRRGTARDPSGTGSIRELDTEAHVTQYWCRPDAHDNHNRQTGSNAVRRGACRTLTGAGAMRGGKRPATTTTDNDQGIQWTEAMTASLADE